MDRITFTIEQIRYHNKENGYTVMSVEIEGSHDSATVVCSSMLDPAIGMSISANGDWETSKYGKQFKVIDYEENLISSQRALINYLGGGFFKGIGPSNAKKIVDYFGDKTIDVIENHSECLYSVKGIGKKKIDGLIEKWKEHKCVLDIMLYFKEFNFTNNFILKIYKVYGCDAIDIISKNPYQMVVDIDGIGFKKADDVAIKMGVDLLSPQRCCAGITYALASAAEEGHTYLTMNTLLNRSIELLGINSDVINNNIQGMIDDIELISIDDNIFLPMYYRAELSVAKKLLELNDFKPYVFEHVPLSIEDIELSNNIVFNQQQKDAINTALSSNIMILTGGPGTGKTTVLKGIVQMLQSLNLHIGAAAPTGKAAKRMSQVTGIDAKTIHRLLDYNPAFGYGFDEDNPLPYDVIILDEVSMMNILLSHSFFKAVTPRTKVILVGDVDQLPAIGPGNVLHDCIESGNIPTIRLTEIFRQSEDSEIILNAHAINNGKPISINNSKPDNDFFFIKRGDDEVMRDEIVELVSQRLPKKYGVEPTDIQVLSPMRKFTMVGSDELNTKLQAVLNPNGESINFGKTTFRVNDKVMQIKNNYAKEVFNGDTGFITHIDTEERIITVLFDDNKIVDYDGTEFDELVLAYACTIHKSQGSEYPIVLIPITKSHYRMLQRNLIYTAITRSKQICILIGQANMLSYAVNNTNYSKRNTYLKKLLQNETTNNID